MKPPITPDDITPEWLTAALRASGTLKNASVVDLSQSPVGGNGYVAQVVRLAVRYDRLEAGAPATMFAKLAPLDPRGRQILRTIIEAETGFYRDLSSGFPVRTPRVYLELHDAESDTGILLLEDLGGYRFGDDVAGCSPGEATRLMRHLARLHAHFWCSPTLSECRWLLTPDHDAGTLPELYEATLWRFELMFADYASERLIEAARRFGEVLPERWRRYSGPPWTLVHGDFRLDNMAFGPDPVLFDWGGARRARGTWDVAYFLASSMDPKPRRESEKALLSEYFETLLAHGVTGYTREEFDRDFREALGAPLVTIVVAGGLLESLTAPTIAHARRVCERVDAVLTDHAFLESF